MAYGHAVHASEEIMHYEIEKKIEIPPRGVRTTRRKYPFNKLGIGDSFFVPIEELSYSKDPSSLVSSAASVYGRRKGGKFVTRQVLNENGEVSGYRVWRID